MQEMNPKIDLYLEEGCGRCKLHATPQCKVHSWPQELRALRRMLLESGLVEELKWSIPCYTLDGKNIAVLAAFKDYCSLSFFKGALLKDEKKLLQSGENTQSASGFRFTSIDPILEKEDLIKAYIHEAIEVEKAGLKAEFKQKDELELPEELLQKFAEIPELEAAFKALTPGRQRGYVLHFSQAKQAATRISRIEKQIPKIMEGKGFFD
jgi:uncharacterized protein YdeI (YjbR/CyaY-like superfamily)